MDLDLAPYWKIEESPNTLEAAVAVAEVEVVAVSPEMVVGDPFYIHLRTADVAPTNWGLSMASSWCFRNLPVAKKQRTRTVMVVPEASAAVQEQEI